MKRSLVILINRILGVVGLRLIRAESQEDVESAFHSWHYLRHNSRRLEHLASLALPVSGKTVLELGAGIGDHSSFYIDRGCKITITDSRAENIEYVERRYPGCDAYQLDLEDESFPGKIDKQYDVIHCYGLLYHLSNPEFVIQQLARFCKEMMMLETAVSFGAEEENYQVKEDPTNPSQAMSGTGSRPTRPWLFALLKKHFKHVYMPLTQPVHEEFPVDWNTHDKSEREVRAVFICSNTALESPLLSEELTNTQTRQV